MKKLTYRRLTCNGKSPRNGYTLFCEGEGDEEFELYEIFVPPDAVEVISLEFITGDIPWDKNLPVKGRIL